ncbi:MAG: hypothetical protein P8Y42_10360 [Exilibacterium sp.]
MKGDGGYLTMNWSFKNFDITSITSALDGEFYNPVDGDGIFPASAFSGSFGVADNKKLEEVANDVVTYTSFNMSVRGEPPSLRARVSVMGSNLQSCD